MSFEIFAVFFWSYFQSLTCTSDIVFSHDFHCCHDCLTLKPRKSATGTGEESSSRTPNDQWARKIEKFEILSKINCRKRSPKKSQFSFNFNLNAVNFCLFYFDSISQGLTPSLSHLKSDYLSSCLTHLNHRLFLRRQNWEGFKNRPVSVRQFRSHFVEILRSEIKILYPSLSGCNSTSLSLCNMWLKEDVVGLSWTQAYDLRFKKVFSKTM